MDFVILASVITGKQAIINNCGSYCIVSLYDSKNDLLRSYKGMSIDIEITKLVNTGFVVM